MAYKLTNKETGQSISFYNAQRAAVMSDLMLNEQDFEAALNDTHGLYVAVYIPEYDPSYDED